MVNLQSWFCEYSVWGSLATNLNVTLKLKTYHEFVMVGHASAPSKAHLTQYA